MIQTLQEIVRQKIRFIIPLVILLLLNVILLAVAGMYLEPRLNTLESRLGDVRRQTAAAGSRDIATVYKQGKADLETLLRSVPVKRKFPGILGGIMEAAHTEGVTTGNVTYKPSVIKDQNLSSYTITMAVSGNYAQLKSFLDTLQQTRELVVVDQVTMANSSPFEENITMDLHVTVYLQEGA